MIDNSLVDDIPGVEGVASVSRKLEVSLIIETYNLVEGTDRVCFAKTIQRAAQAAKECNGELIITDVSGDPAVTEFVTDAAPGARLIDAVGMSYDEAKMLAAAEACSPILVFLDSDCEPLGNWPHELLDALQSQQGKAGVAGYTRYRGTSVLSAVMSVMDFGFFYPVVRRSMACYAFNNAAFRRSALLDCPIPTGPMRCGCFSHAQSLLRQGKPLMLATNAVAIHDLPPIVRERTRQGHDTIAACWMNPTLPEARWLELGVLSVPVFLAMRVALDWKRLLTGRHNLNLSLFGLVAGLALAPILRLLDAAGMVHAFWAGRNAPAWGGWQW
jgi:hypothetical protein